MYIDARRMSVDQVIYSLVYRAFIRLLQGESAETYLQMKGQITVLLRPGRIDAIYSKLMLSIVQLTKLCYWSIEPDEEPGREETNSAFMGG